MRSGVVLGGPIAILLIICIAVLVAWILAIYLFIDTAKKKRICTSEDTGKFWFIGLFASPFILGLYLLFLENKGAVGIAAPISSSTPSDDLPSV